MRQAGSRVEQAWFVFSQSRHHSSRDLLRRATVGTGAVCRSEGFFCCEVVRYIRQCTEISNCIDPLVRVDADTGFMHESFDKDDSSKFTRTSFAWANALFAALVVRLSKEKPHLLK